MPDYVAIKMKSGEDIVGVLLNDEEEFVTVYNPISIHVDPERGFMVKSWNFLSKSNSVALPKGEMLLLDDASDRAIMYYEEFITQHDPINEKNAELEDYDEDQMSELEEMFDAMLENKTATKH